MVSALSAGMWVAAALVVILIGNNGVQSVQYPGKTAMLNLYNTDSPPLSDYDYVRKLLDDSAKKMADDFRIMADNSLDFGLKRTNSAGRLASYAEAMNQANSALGPGRKRRSAPF
ncbi:hypothetical protein BV898_06482 [Hypsibius exemplaris]|uniref:Uncharacterized protein n=1 Tax=Hypsibius exemplaris TaxID=2072580 RepID=A0A1W0WWC7_HYPEX|nr:hypothetical protein BV898_06482 [Hypsibius exemplaris]